MGFKVKATLILVTLLALALGDPVQAKMTHKTVQAEGIGGSLNQAIYNALDEAIGRVNGKSIESRQQIESVEIAADQDGDESYFSSEAYQSKIKSATRGVVESYEILSRETLSDGLQQVVLSATVAKFEARNSNRKRIAVFPIRIGSGRFVIKGAVVDKDRVGRLVTHNLVTTLVQSRKFTVLDREYMSETIGEQALALSSQTPVSEMARLGQELVADYIMVGTIENLNYTERKIQMKSSGRELLSREGNVELSIRLIDVATRQIDFSDFLKLRVMEKDLERFGGNFGSGGVDAGLAMVAADRVGRKIIETIYPLVVVAVNGQVLTLGQGGSQIKEGDRLDIYMYGERMTDPYTKEFLGREEIKIGAIEITRVTPKQSQARLLQSSLDIDQAFEPKKFICRVKLENGVQKEILRKERRKARDERRKKRDEDW